MPEVLENSSSIRSGGAIENGGVCCVGDTCFVVPEENCGCSSCTYPDVLCNEVDCSIVVVKGACCLESGECLSNQTPEACADVAGNYQGDDTSCADVDCPQPEPTGACCVNGNCISDLTAGECAAGSGEYEGDGTSCDFVNCDAVGDYVEFKHVIVGENLVPGIGPNFTVDIMAAVLPGNRIDAVAGNSAQSKVLSSTNGFYQNPNGGPLSTDINPNFYAFVPELEWDSRDHRRWIRPVHRSDQTTSEASASTGPSSRTVEHSTSTTAPGTCCRMMSRAMPNSSSPTTARTAKVSASLV